MPERQPGLRQTMDRVQQSFIGITNVRLSIAQSSVAEDRVRVDTERQRDRIVPGGLGREDHDQVHSLRRVR